MCEQKKFEGSGAEEVMGNIRRVTLLPSEDANYHLIKAEIKHGIMLSEEEILALKNYIRNQLEKSVEINIRQENTTLTIALNGVSEKIAIAAEQALQPK